MIISNKKGVTFSKMDLPEVLYKYRDWNNPFHKTILTERKVFFAQPTSFEDPLDCKNLTRFDLLTEDQIREFFSDNLSKKHPNWSDDRLQSEIEYWVENTPVRNKEWVKQRIQEDFENYDKCLGVLSLTANQFNDEMWEKYGNSHTGFAIGIDPVYAFQFFGGGGSVVYCEKLPIIQPVPFDSVEEQVHKQVYHKLAKWSFEQEYRTTILRPTPLTEEQRTIVLPAECFRKVVIGSKMPEEVMNDLISSIPPELNHIEVIKEH